MKSSVSARTRTVAAVSDSRASSVTFLTPAALKLVTAVMLIFLTVIFLSARNADIGKLPLLIRSFAASLLSEKVFAMSGVLESFSGLVVALLLLVVWYGAGDLLLKLCRLSDQSDNASVMRASDLARRFAFGAGLWSFLWFLLGLAGLYRKDVAVVALIAGLLLFAWSLKRLITVWQETRTQTTETGTRQDWLWLVTAISAGVAVLSALLTALAPPVGKDALIYHLALPKAFLTAGGLVEVPYNIAGYYALGVEMHGVWAMLLGSLCNARVAEAAFGATTFSFYPLLLLAVYGWARELRLNRAEACLAAVMIATIPTVWLSAASGYTDLALSLYLVLLIQAVAQWWRTLKSIYLVQAAIALGFALTIKLIAVFSVFPLALLLLLKARQAQGNEASSSAQIRRIMVQGLLTLLCGGLLGSQWYLRNWITTGSPVFPFYTGMWPGSAPGWDAERSQMCSIFLSGYGGLHKSLSDYLATPLYLSLTAQPELHTHYDGVLGISFLLGLPLLILLFRHTAVGSEVKIAVCFSAALYLFWLFSSEQLRFLVPALPGLAVAVVTAATKLSGDDKRKTGGTFKWLTLAGTTVGLLVICAWFLEKNPVRAVAGGEPRANYLARQLDYYPYYEIVNTQLPADARVWLINMRRDTYHIERSYFSDYLFEDYTITKLVNETQSVSEMRTRVRAMGITHLLLRHDVLLDYARSPIVNEKRAEAENQQKMALLKSFLTEGTKVMRSDQKFMLIELP